MSETPLNTTGNQTPDDRISILMQSMAKGDPAALLALYDKTGAPLYRLMSRVPGDGAATEGAVLDTYTQLWRQAGAWVESPSFLRLADHLDGIIGGTDSAETGETPPAYLRDMLATRIKREPQLSGNAPVVQPAGREAELFRSMKPPTGAPERSRLQTVFLWVIAGACALIAGVATYQWLQAGQLLDRAILRQQETEAGALKAQESLRSELEKARPGEQKIGQINAILASRGARVVGLVSQSPDTDLAQAVFLDAPGHRCAVAGHIRPAPEGKAYQLWFVTLASYVSGGLIKPDASGLNFDLLALDPGLQKITSIMITLEPEGGSRQPTMPPLALGRVGP